MPRVPSSTAPGRRTDRFVVYRDSTRGLNEDDEIFVVRADGTRRRNITNNPANDWGPDWSPDGSTIVFNSDRDGGLRGFYADPDGSNLRPVGVNAWFEYPAWSPDGSRIVFEGAVGGNYEIYVLDVETGEVTQLTDAPGDNSWAIWSPDGASIAFSSERDDCRVAVPTEDCWDDGEPNDDHRDIWLMDADGSNSAPGDTRDRAVRRVLARWRIPAHLRPSPVRRPAGRDGPPRASRRGDAARVGRHPRLDRDQSLAGRSDRLAASRTLELGDVDLDHLEHGLERAGRRLAIGPVEELGQPAWDDLPGHPEPVLQPAADALLAAVRRERRPVAIDLGLVLRSRSTARSPR